MGGKRKRKAENAGSSNKRHKSVPPSLNGPALVPLELDKLDFSPFTEDLKGENRKREAKTYELLGSTDSDVRVAVATNLVTALLAGTESVLQRHLDKRLFRGLASSRNASRVGFSIVLTEILRQLFGPEDLARKSFPGLTFDKVLGILVENTEAGGNIPGQEERDFFFGRLFGLQCFVEAKILFDDESRWPTVSGLLLQMADKKVWMRSYTGWVIVQSLPQMGQAQAEKTLQEMAALGLGKTAEGVAIWLHAQICYPGLKTPAKPWHDPLSTSALPEVARVLRDSVAQDTGEDAAIVTARQGNWTAQLHFVWDVILAAFNGQGKDDKKYSNDQFKLFWTTVIDDGLFSKTASDAQKFRGFMIFQKFLKGLMPTDSSTVSALFTRNLMKCLINQAAKEDRYLHRAALKTLQSIEKYVEQNAQLLIPILKQLIGKHGLYDFDRRTNTKTIENLLQRTDSASIKQVLKLLRDPVTRMKGDTADEADKFRQAYADYVFKMTTHAKIAPEAPSSNKDSIVSETGARELASWAYSQQSGFEPDVSEKTREVFRARLSSTFAKVIKEQQNARYLCEAVVSLEPTAVEMSVEIESVVISAQTAMRKLLETKKKKDDTVGIPSLGLALLYAVTILQVYDGAPDAIGITQDLQSCSERIENEEAGISELLVEILLILVSRQSPMMRQTSEQVFQSFTSQLTREALDLLTGPLLAEENANGYHALFENLDDEDVDMDGTESSGSDEENDDDDENMSEVSSDVEFTTLNGDEISAQVNGSENEEDSEGNEAEDKELADLDDALAKVLDSHRLDKDNDATSSDDDSDMTDSEMMALDDKLVEVFKQRAKTTSQKKDKKDAKESIITFKHRILDLLDIYVKQEASNPLAFGLLLPLLELARTTTAKPLANKAARIITDFSRASKKTRSSSSSSSSTDKAGLWAPDAEKLFKIMEGIHEEVSKDQSHTFARAASTASLLVASSLFAADRDLHAARVNALYAESATRYQLGQTRIQRAFFSDWMNWFMGYASNNNARSGDKEQAR